MTKFRSFKEARAFVWKLGLKHEVEWRAYLKTKKKPSDIPANPDRVYKDEGWTTWGDFLGTGIIGTGQIRQHMLSYEEAEIEAHRICVELKIDSPGQWRKAYDEGKIPKNLPRSPASFYNKKTIEALSKK